MAADAEHPRLILHNFLSLDLCRELGFIHKSCCTVGYRPNVFSTTLSHLIATNSAHLILPFISIRESLKEKAEEFFGCEYQLFIEFTGLISWSKGASIGWHSDDNRPYLKQRDFAAVCYLNSHGEDFNGGLFCFQDGEPTTVVPVSGDVIMYTADSRNIHSVDEVLQFCFWKAFELRETEVGRAISNVVPLSQSLQEKSSGRKLTMGDHQLAEMVFHCISNHDDSKPAFGWADLHAAVVAWGDYTCKLRKELLIRFPYWRTYHSIFFVPLVDLEKEA
ncbi:uncharacterized protein LOC122669759 isoform X3 [Telopea speciosissima]|uniref:uncharacterized protein LOC122669759 isoform X3 n=1 Tax=Telopea speciosissima TaxID=54955 RepID=UPI001CC3DC81|nr:uncharacterized protein LOC122669759 isoform X3 [Telopea speciosissima]